MSKNAPKSKAVELLEAELNRLDGEVTRHLKEENWLNDRARHEREAVSKLHEEIHEVERDLNAINRLTGGEDA